jgi:hypothetical protein
MSSAMTIAAGILSFEMKLLTLTFTNDICSFLFTKTQQSEISFQKQVQNWKVFLKQENHLNDKILLLPIKQDQYRSNHTDRKRRCQ